MPEEEEEGFDLDRIFAYDTVKEVRVIDRRLGLIYYATYGMVVFYVVIYTMIIKRQYLDNEKSNGFIMTKVLNPSYANDTIPFDVFEAVANPGESGALFVPTRVMVTKGQSQKGSCENPGFPCESDEDCDSGDDMNTGKCSKGMCVRRGWCPAETIMTPGTEVYKIDAKSYDLWFQGRVLFHKFRADVGNTEDPSPIFYPNENANTYPMHDILRMAEVGVEDIWKDGAIILVNALFKCDLSNDRCETTIESVAVDTATGFNFKQAVYYEEGGERKRDSYWFYGIRLVIFASGFGERPSIAQVVLQLSQAIALLGCAASVADFFLQAVVPERKHYIAEKIIETEDFGD